MRETRSSERTLGSTQQVGPVSFVFSNAPYTIVGGTGKFDGVWGTGTGSGSFDVQTRAIDSAMRGSISFSSSDGKKFFCKGGVQPSGYGIVSIEIAGASNPCGQSSATYYIEPFHSGLRVCGSSVWTIGYVLYPNDYRVAGVDSATCAGGESWVIERLSSENNVCVLTNVIGAQLVAAPGYIVTSVGTSGNCPGPIVTITQPKKGDIACDPLGVAAIAPYVLPGGFSLTPVTAPACPGFSGFLLGKLGK